MADRLFVTCEHAGNVVPRTLPRRSSSVTKHCCRRTAAGTRARCCSRARWPSASHAPLYFDETTRLLADLNRSVGSPELHSEATRHSDAARAARAARRLLPPASQARRRRHGRGGRDRRPRRPHRLAQLHAGAERPRANGRRRHALRPGPAGRGRVRDRVARCAPTRRPVAPAAPQLSLHRQERRRVPDHASQVLRPSATSASSSRSTSATSRPAGRRGRTSAGRSSRPSARRFSCAAAPGPTGDRPAAPARPGKPAGAG